MKSTILFVILLGISCSLFANPIDTSMWFSEVWFNADGHFMMEIVPSDYYTRDDIYLSDGKSMAEFSDNLAFTQYDSTIVYDLTEQMPALSFHPEGDSIWWSIKQGEQYHELCHLCWGGGLNDGWDDISALLPGQSIVQNRFDGIWGPICFLYKDSPPSPGTSPNRASKSASIKFDCKDQNGLPVPYVLIDNVFDDFRGFTGPDGGFEIDVYSRVDHFHVAHPQTGEIVYSSYQWWEPQQYYIPITINLDPNQSFEHDLPNDFYLKVNPNPVYQNNTEFVTFQLLVNNGKTPKSLHLKIYNVKGQYITELTALDKNKFVWKLGKELGSGQYFARLISGNRVLDGVRFVVVK